MKSLCGQFRFQKLVDKISKQIECLIGFLISVDYIVKMARFKCFQVKRINYFINDTLSEMWRVLMLFSSSLITGFFIDFKMNLAVNLTLEPFITTSKTTQNKSIYNVPINGFVH